MSMRRMLFIIIPVLFIVSNSVSFFIFQSGRTVQQSYNMMLERVLLYKEIDEQTQDNLRAINMYLKDRSDSSRQAYQDQRAELNRLLTLLSVHTTTPETELSVRSYRHMLETYLEQEGSLVSALSDQNSLAYAEFYADAEQTAAFIQEEGHKLIDLELSYYQPIYRQILLQTEAMNSWGIVIFILNTLISVLFAYWISLQITRPIHQLVETAEHISNGNLEVIPPPLRDNSEFRILSDSFVTMQDNLKALIIKEKEGLEKDRLVKELELEVLQNQINPHFLFNSLNVLSKLALIEGAEKTSDLIVTMSNLLRYNLRQLDRLVPLRDEVEHAKEYFTIQQARFRERIRFETNIDQDGLDVLVPVLTLQPILENVFVHGIEGREEGAVIKLTITSKENETWISISDNGVGMSEETRQSLLNYNTASTTSQWSERSGHSTGLGTRNVFKRIELCYGDTDRIEIKSKPGQGTTVIIRIPAAGKEDGDVSLIDRR